MRWVVGASPDDAAQGRDVVNGREEALDAEDGGTSQSRGAGDSRLAAVSGGHGTPSRNPRSTRYGFPGGVDDPCSAFAEDSPGDPMLPHHARLSTLT